MVKVKIANSPEINIYENINLVLNLNDNYILDKIFPRFKKCIKTRTNRTKNDRFEWRVYVETKVPENVCSGGDVSICNLLELRHPIKHSFTENP